MLEGDRSIANSRTYRIGGRVGEIFRLERAPQPLEFNGERFTTEASGSIETEHLHRYFLAREVCKGKDVLDVASGEGYGTAILSQVARSAIGVEVDQAAVLHAQNSYSRQNLRFLLGDAREIPLPDSSVDVVVSFETLEHIVEHDVFLGEVKRVLRPGGMAIVSTPDRDVYSPAGKPANPHHVRELTREQFLSTLKRKFSECELYLQRPFAGSAVVPALLHSRDGHVISFEKRAGTHVECDSGLPRAVYLIAAVSDRPIPALLSASLYIDNAIPEINSAANGDSTILQVFLAADQTYSEECSIKRSISLNTWQTIAFDLKDTVHGRLRIDPTDRQALIEIANIELTDRQSGNVVWSSTMPGAWNQVQVSGSALPTPHEGVFRVLSIGTDPQLVLPQLSIFDTQIRLELSLRVDGRPEAVFEHLDRQYRSRIEASEQEIERWKVQVHASENERLLTLADLRHAIVDRNNLSRDLARAEEIIEQSAIQIRLNATELQDQVTRLRDELAAAQAQLRAEQEQSTRIIRSLSWRVTQPVRGSMEILRRFAKR